MLQYVLNFTTDCHTVYELQDANNNIIINHVYDCGSVTIYFILA